MTQLIVRNTNDFDHADSYNGQDFHFPKGEKVLIDSDAAMHMFGFNRKDKTENLIRLGWANTNNPNEGPQKLAKFVFTQAVMVEAPAEEPPEPEVEQVEDAPQPVIEGGGAQAVPE